MAAVWKYTLEIGDSVAVRMPTGARPLHVAEQHGQLCMWVQVDPSKPLATRFFRIYGTGHELHKGLTYIGTALLQDGAFVLHVFDNGEVG